MSEAPSGTRAGANGAVHQRSGGTLPAHRASEPADEPRRVLVEAGSALAIVRCQYHRALARAAHEDPSGRGFWYAEARRLLQVAVALTRKIRSARTASADR